MALEGEFEGEKVTLINLYGSSGSKASRDELFRRVRRLGRPKGTVILGGDFNCVLDRELDRSRVGTAGTETDELQSLLEEWRLTDAAAEYQLAVYSEADQRRFHAEHHTFRYPYGEAGLASSRLDRFYISTSCMKRLANLEVTPPLHTSDHDALWLTLTEPSPPPGSKGPRRLGGLRYPMTAVDLEVVNEVADRSLSSLEAELATGTPNTTAQAWDTTKGTIVSTSLTKLREQRRRVRRAYRQRKRRLKAYLRQIQKGPGPIDPSLPGITDAMAVLTLDRRALWQRVRSELISMSEAETLRRRQRTFAAHAGTGADAARAFSRRIQMKFQQRPALRLQPDPARPPERMAADWRLIMQRGPMDPAEQDAFFAGLPAPRALVTRAPLLLPCTEDEVAAAIAACPRGKASGFDGIPNDWYRDNSQRLTPLLTQLFNMWYTAGVLPANFAGATIFCIPKKKEPRSGLDFRPIALLNSDYKIFSRVLLTRVKVQLERVISPTQFGFVPDRQVHDALDVWAAIVDQVAKGAISDSGHAGLRQSVRHA